MIEVGKKYCFFVANTSFAFVGEVISCDDNITRAATIKNVIKMRQEECTVEFFEKGFDEKTRYIVYPVNITMVNWNYAGEFLHEIPTR